MPDLKSRPQTQRTGPPHNPGLRKLIKDKRQWHRPARLLPLEGDVPSTSGTLRLRGSSGTSASTISPGTPVSAGSRFLGWHERGYLPHFDAPNVT